MANVKHTTEKALKMLRNLPRVTLGNIRDNPKAKQNVKNYQIVWLNLVKSNKFL